MIISIISIIYIKDNHFYLRRLAELTRCFMETSSEIPILGALTNYYYYNLYLYPDSSSATTPPRPSSRCVLVRARATATSAPSCGRRGSGWSSRATPPLCRYTRGTCGGVTCHVSRVLTPLCCRRWSRTRCCWTPTRRRSSLSG